MLNDLDQYSTSVTDENDFDSYEIGAYTREAVRQVILTARDNRLPAPPMRAVPLDDVPVWAEDESELCDVVLGQAASEPDPYPLLSSMLVRFGAGAPPRFVRVDTEESYKQFRAENSQEMGDLRDSVQSMMERLARHEQDPDAHSVQEHINELVAIGEEVLSVENAKRIQLEMPKHYNGKIDAWREGEFVCASIVLPGIDGSIRICTSMEPLSKCLEEVSRHAGDAKVPASAVIGVLPAVGMVLGAGTAIKEMASAASSILSQPEAAHGVPFVVRVEPKASPTLCALAALAFECSRGNQQACNEWMKLSSAAGPGPVGQAMKEALALANQAKA